MRKALRVMVSDVKEEARSIYKKSREADSRWLRDTSAKIRNLPRRIADFAKGFGKGYAVEQTLTTAVPYTSRVVGALYNNPRRVPNGAGEFVGGLTGAVQDTMTLYLASNYVDGDHNVFALAGVVVGGTKLVSNTIALGTHWYQCARERVSELETIEREGK
jgi:hypothetical protein